MGDKSNIEWTDATWPIVQGCDPVSPGCALCYAKKVIWRQKHNPNAKVSLPVLDLVKVGAGGQLQWTGVIALRHDRLDWPRRWTRPRMIFVPSHGDLFHEDVPDHFLDEVFGVMENCPQHTFQILTKRASRMRQYLNWRWGEGRIPSRHIWIGVSVEDQARADERIPELLQTIAAVRFLSVEPLLGPVDLTEYLHPSALVRCIKHHNRTNHPCGGCGEEADCETCGTEWVNGRVGIHWVIVGGESGTGARPMHPNWARLVRDQCQAAGVAFFFKQWGEFRPATPDDPPHSGSLVDGTLDCGYYCDESVGHVDHKAHAVIRVGKRAAGRQLDGRTWDEFPRR